MPPKPSFRVKLSLSQQENVSGATSTTMMSFALLGTLAEDEDKLLRKSQREPTFQSSNVQKTRLSDWDLNISNTAPLLDPSSTSIAYGMPTPQTPLNMLDLGYAMELDTGPTDNIVDRAGSRGTIALPVTAQQIIDAQKQTVLFSSEKLSRY
ncbi:hypothetical protein BDZ97DRAFT_1844894 [Flammula alnicola]|nr:hypothetical protein BDZ97DRAFT_1844894 [Flammula alnicola]